MKSSQIRQKFIKFFSDHGHQALPSSSLIPDNDPSVLLTTAGMQQFKPYFLGDKDPLKHFGTKRVATIQKSFRTSDIDQVGDLTHLTFFEMLGNFSFGDYWKQEAINLAWEFLTVAMKLPPARLWVSVFAGDKEIPRDNESEKKWRQLVPPEHLIALGRDDNFWGPPGKSGSCGPCSEIYWQIDPARGGQPGDQSGNFVEIWNLVFTEFYQDDQNKLHPLPQKNIDTGMGLERLSMAVQGLAHLFATDIYQPLMAVVAKMPGFGDVGQDEINARRQRIVADHIRGACFLLADGVRFSNKDQGYILRRIVRRAADQFLISEISFTDLVTSIVAQFGQSYPELKKQQDNIITALNDELQQYRKVLDLDVATLISKIRRNKKAEGTADQQGFSHLQLSAAEAFSLYSTHGISLDRLERLGFNFNKNEVEKLIIGHQEISRAGAPQKFGGHGLGHGPATMGLDPATAWKITRLHTATHLLQAALRKILGPTVGQNGSDINDERLRFDFTFDRKLTPAERQQVEDLVNEKIQADLPVTWKMMPYQPAIDSGALAFFKNKYGAEVKVYSAGDFSKELCDGPHVEHTGQIGQLKITADQSVGAGLRRIKAITVG